MKQPKIPMHERGIEARLINWGLCQRGKGGGTMVARETRRSSPYGGQGYQCMTAVVINRMREAANGPKGGAAQSGLDFNDAEVINRAWQRIPVSQFKHKLLLRDLYVLGHSPNSICRSLDIKHWPLIHWQRALKAAQEAVEQLLDSGK